EPVRPPTSTKFRRLFKPRLCFCGACGGGPKEGLGVTGRAEQALDMAAVGEHEGAAVSEELSRLVDASPRRDVICHAGDDIAVHIYATHLERYAPHVKLASVDERIGIDEIEKIGMQACG